MQKTFYKTLLCFFLFIVSASVIWGQDELSEHYGEWSTQHFKIMMSEDWYSIDNPYTTEIYSISRPSQFLGANLQPSINFVSIPLSELDVTADELLLFDEDYVSAMFPGAVLESRKSIQIMGQKAEQIEVSLEENGITMLMLITIFANGDQGCNFTYVAEEEDYLIFKEEAEAILASFTFIAEADRPKEIEKDTSAILIFENLYFLTKEEENHFGFFQQERRNKVNSIEGKRKDAKEAFNLLFAIGNVDFMKAQQYEEKYFSFLDNLAKEIPAKKRQKRIQEIFDLIHEAFFDEYLENVLFYSIFKDRTYNCVTASALYGIAFDYLDIPYVVKEMPTHVYLIAYPDDNRVVLETTNSDFGFMPLNQTEMKKRKKFLLSNDFISEEAASFMDSEMIYNQEYKEDLEIDLENLIGILYYNHSILESDVMNFDKALIEIEKGCELYDSDQLLAWRQDLNYVLTEKESKHLSINQFCMMANKIYKGTSNQGFTNEDYLEYFTNFLISIFHNYNEGEKMTDFVQCFDRKIDNVELIESMEYRTRLMIGEMHFYKGDVEKALKVFKENYRADDEQSVGLLEGCVIEYLNNFKVNEAIFDTINKLKVEFPFLVENEQLERIEMVHFLFNAINFFKRQDASKGIKYLNYFKASYGEKEQLLPPYDLIDQAFADASAYYVRKKKYPIAKQYLLEGLELNPKSSMLNRKLNVLIDFVGE